MRSLKQEMPPKMINRSWTACATASETIYHHFPGLPDRGVFTESSGDKGLAMDKQLRFIFVSEIVHQTGFALMAFDDLNAALAKHDHERVWYSVQGMLVAVGNVSKILWPIKKYKERGDVLRQVLGVRDDSVLAPRTLRSHFEHFDARLEIWASSPHRALLDSNIGPPGMFKGFDATQFLRNFDTKNFAVTFGRDSYPLQPIATDIRELRSRASELRFRFS